MSLQQTLRIIMIRNLKLFQRLHARLVFFIRPYCSRRMLLTNLFHLVHNSEVGPSERVQALAPGTLFWRQLLSWRVRLQSTFHREMITNAQNLYLIGLPLQSPHIPRQNLAPHKN